MLKSDDINPSNGVTYIEYESNKSKNGKKSLKTNDSMIVKRGEEFSS